MAIPSLALVPTGYKAGKVYSVLPESGVGDFAFTRASAATRTNSNGLLEVAQYSIGSELVTNGDFATDSDWTKGAGWTISGGVASCVSDNNNLSQNVGVTANKNYKVTFDVSAYTSGTLAIDIGSSSSQTTTSSGSKTFYFTTTSANDLRFYGGAFRGSIDNVSVIEWEINDVPRLEYPLIDGVVNGCPSLLLENQATNLITYPISFGNSYWTKSGATIEGDPSTAGSELITNGDFSNGTTGWVFDADWSVVNNQATTLGVSLSPIRQTVLVNGINKLTIDIVQGGVFVYTNYPNFSKKAEFTTVGTHTIDLSSDGVGNNQILYIYNNGAGNSATIDNVSVKEVQGYSSPSVDFPTSAFKLVEGTNNGIHRLLNNSAVSLTGDFTNSVFAKKGERNWIRLVNNNLAGAYFDLQNGVVGSISAGFTADIIEYSNGWYKCSISGNRVGTQSERVIVYTSIDGLTDSYTGDGTSGIYLFMAQLEQGSYATSPTLTSLTAEGTTTTRVAETCNGAGDASTFNDSEGVLMTEISYPASTTATNHRIAISDGTGTNRIIIQNVSSNPNTIQGYVIVNGGISTDVSITINNITAYNKILIKYKENDFALWINGFELVTDTSGVTFPNGILTELAFDGGEGTRPFYGNTKQIQYFNTVLTSAELETLTSWTSFTAMANAQQYNII